MLTLLCNQSLELLLSYKAETLYPLNTTSLFSPPQTLGNHDPTLCLDESNHSLYLIYIEAYSICPFVASLFH